LHGREIMQPDAVTANRARQATTLRRDGAAMRTDELTEENG
jgi:hypothetical protein